MRTSRFGSIQCRLLQMAAALGLFATLPAWSAEIILYAQDNFRGRSFVSEQTVSNFANVGFNDRASSAVIRGGSWQLCTDAYFRGRCETLPPGEYPTLRSMRLENQVSSVREVGWQGGPGPGRPGPGPGPRAMVELYENDGFGGRVLPINNAENNFPNSFNDRASSMIIHDGYWEACENIGYHGRCQVYGPGRYANLGSMSNRISSIRPVAAPPQPGGPPGGGWGSGGSRAILYADGNYSGRMVVLNNDVVANLAATGFNDRASSMRIEGGYWMFCSDADFLGQCYTFGPGDYATLPGGLNNRISSGRRIRDYYPYSQSPNWQR
jgi:hypothetical protein